MVRDTLKLLLQGKSSGATQGSLRLIHGEPLVFEVPTLL